MNCVLLFIFYCNYIYCLCCLVYLIYGNAWYEKHKNNYFFVILLNFPNILINITGNLRFEIDITGATPVTYKISCVLYPFS